MLNNFLQNFCCRFLICASLDLGSRSFKIINVVSAQMMAGQNYSLKIILKIWAVPHFRPVVTFRQIAYGHLQKNNLDQPQFEECLFDQLNPLLNVLYKDTPVFNSFNHF